MGKVGTNKNILSRKIGLKNSCCEMDEKGNDNW